MVALSREPEGPDGNGNKLKPSGYIRFNLADDRKMRQPKIRIKIKKCQDQGIIVIGED